LTQCYHFVMVDFETIQLIRTKYDALYPIMDERTRRYWAASEALALGWGGTSAVARATGLSRPTIIQGIRALKHQSVSTGKIENSLRVRRPGGGRKSVTITERGLQRALERLLDSNTRGDPQSPLRWTCKSSRQLAEELERQGHPGTHPTVTRLLHDLDYSLQANRKTQEGADHPDRDEQFEHISRKVKAFQRRSQPVILVDAKKKELIGEFKQTGREWCPKGTPIKVRTHDFADPDLGKAIPYGVYDLTNNEGWVSVGINHDTAEFAVEPIRRWWKEMGCQSFPKATELLITADSGGSNAHRSRLWKFSLQGLANQIGLKIRVCHFPPGTSKWNKIEHRMFCHITQNWRGQPLVSRSVVVNLIGNTTTRTGLSIRAKLDKKKYTTGIKITDEELAGVNLKKDKFHGDWNYSILPENL
jgi:hypothetical protein